MIYIIRHGKTELNRKNALQGRSDHPLNEEGLRQAEDAAEILRGIRFERVFSSPLVRALRTAEIVSPGSGIEIDSRLTEMDYGPYEGLDLTRMPPEVLTFFSDFTNNPAPEGMEQLSSVVERAGSFLDDIRSETGNILISTHAIAMKGLLECLTPGSNGSYWSKHIANCAVWRAENAGGRIGVPEEIYRGEAAGPLRG